MQLTAFLASPFLDSRARPWRLLALVAAATTGVCGCGLFRGTPPAPAPVARHVELPVDNGLPPAAQRALNQRFPYLHPVGHSSGHLQVDDADDLAVVLAPVGQSNDSIVAVLVTGAVGEYRVAT